MRASVTMMLHTLWQVGVRDDVLILVSNDAVQSLTMLQLKLNLA